MAEMGRPGSIAIVGAGLAGARLACALRERGYAGRVTLIGAERAQPYDRPPLTKELFDRETPAPLTESGVDGLAAADEALLGWRAVRLTGGLGDFELGLVSDDAARDARVERRLRVASVALACGADSILPPGWRAHTLRSWADAVRLRARLKPGRHLVIVGSGWIGAELASSAATAGVRCTVIEAAASPAPALGPAVGERTRAWFAGAGVELMTSARVTGADETGCRLDDGRRVDADCVVAAVGVRPATGWLADAGLDLAPDGAVAVDLGGLARPGIWAVGDCASVRASLGYVPGGHWEGAMRDPDAVAATMLGEPAPQRELPRIFSRQFGHDLVLIGMPWLADCAELVGDGPWQARYLREVEDRDALVAVLAVDGPRQALRARAEIRASLEELSVSARSGGRP